MILSAANFVAEPRDLFETRLPPHLRGHCPHVFAHPEGGEGWSWHGERPERVFGWGFAGERGPPRWRFDQLPPAAVDPAAHLAAMDTAGIDGAVIYPLGLIDGWRQLGPEMRRTCMTVYNDWAGGTFEAAAPNRLIAPRMLPPLETPWATARELARALQAGARAVYLADLPHDVGADADARAVVGEMEAAQITLCVAAADSVALKRVRADHPGLCVVVVSVEAARAAALPPARLYDAGAPDGADLWCADLPRHTQPAPAGGGEAGENARRAFGLESRPTKRTLHLSLAIPVRNPTAPSSSRLPSVALAATNLVDDGPLTARSLAASARRIEAMGFRGIWVGDVVARRPGMQSPDPFTMLGIAAAATEQVELGTCVFQVPLRGRVETAHRALSMHQLAPGRFTFGVGAGSTQHDFDAVGRSFEGRFRELREALTDIRALWSGQTVGLANLYPRPDALGGPPVLVGSWGGSWVERAGRDYDGWIASGTRTWRALQDAMVRFQAAGGRRAVVSSVFADLGAEDAPLEDDDRVHLACPPEQALARLRRLRQIGFTDVIVFNQGPIDALAELGDLLARDP